MRKLAIVLASFVVLLALLISFVRSEWGSEIVTRWVERRLEKSGFQVQAGLVEGTLPNRLHMEHVEVKGRGLKLFIQSLDLEISLLRLLKNEVSFNELKAAKISWIQLPGGSVSAAGGNSLPRINVDHFKLLDVQIPDLFPLDLEGKLKLSSSRKSLELTAHRPEFAESEAHLTMLLQKNGMIQIRGESKTPTLTVFNQPLPFDASATLYLSASGPFESLWIQGFPSFQLKFRGAFTPKIASFDQEWTLSGAIESKEKIELSNFLGRSALGSFKANGEFSRNLQFLSGSIAAQTTALPDGFSGHLSSYINLTAEQEAIRANATFQIPHLTKADLEIEELQGTADALWAMNILKGTAQATGQLFEKDWQLKSNFSWSPQGPIYLPTLVITGPEASGKGELEISPDLQITGTSELKIDNLHALNLPVELFGSLIVKTQSTRGETHVDLAASDLYYGDFYANKGNLYTDLSSEWKGDIYLDLEKIVCGSLELESASFESNLQEDESPFRIFAEGKWKHPIEVRSSGFWKYKPGEFHASLQEWKGTFYNHPFSMKEAITVDWAPSLFVITPVEINVANAQILAAFDRQKNRVDTHFQLKQLPLDFLSINPLEVPIQGRLDLDTSIHEENGRMKGNLIAAVTEMQIAEQLLASGTIQGEINHDQLTLSSAFTVNQAPLLSLEALVPIHLTLWPPKAELIYDSAAKGELSFNGRVEDFLDFVDLGTHLLEGELEGRLRFSNTLSRPLLEGNFLFKNGIYQNYYTGTDLKNIRAEFLAEKHSLLLRSFTAEDANQGVLAASGEIQLQDKFPFRFDASLNQLQSVDIDLITAAVEGKISVQGDIESALATGDLKITSSTLTVPDHIPRPLPDLQVVYTNATKPTPPPPLQRFNPYPLHLDLHVFAPETISIAGHGVESKWGGDFHIGGLYTEMAAKGKLELIEGTLTFSGRSFKLTDGSVSLSGKAHEMPYLNLTAGTESKGIAITANLNGPLNLPKLTFHSSPPLPLSSIMSYLLFGQDLSEISGFQALQLATSIASIAGEGPDILENTRRSLGLDRLRIVAAPHPEIEGETISIQAGKYVAEGVIVSVSQGAQESSTNASIEVEIKDNLIFQAETDQKQEQGKFTIKWVINY